MPGQRDSKIRYTMDNECPVPLAQLPCAPLPRAVRPSLRTWRSSFFPAMLFLLLGGSLTATPASADGDGFLRNLAASGDRSILHGLLGRSLPAKPCVIASPVYYGEVFNNARGGKTTSGATKYQGLLDISLAFNLETTKLPMPGQVVLLGQNTHGRGITEDFVGDAQVLSNIDSFRNIAQVSEYWWEFGLLDDNVTVRLGKQDVNTEFLVIDMADDFIQSTFGLSPSTAFPTYPNPSMGAVVLGQLTESWQLKLGVWDAFASGGSWGFSGNDSVLVAGELEYAYALSKGKLPGVIAIGAVYESAGEIEGTPISAVQEYYVQFEQWLMQEEQADADAPQGLGIFTGLYPRIPGRLKAAESIGDSLVAGVIYTGLLPGRDRDLCGIGVAWSELFAGGTGEESVWEVFYQVYVTDRINLQPDLQYIATPSGIQRDALVVGMRFELAL